MKHSLTCKPGYILAGFLLLTLVSSLGNGLILLVLATRKRMRNAVNLVIGNIAFADMIACIIVSVNAVGRNWNHDYVFSHGYCRYNPFFKDVSINISDLSLVVLLYERFKARMVPRVPETTLKMAMFECSLTWVYAVVAFHWELGNYASLIRRSFGPFIQYSCELQGDFFVYEMIISVFTLYLPNLLTTVLNSYLVYKMWRSRRQLEGVIEDRNPVNESLLETERLITIMIIANLLATFIAWFPEQYIFLSPSVYSKLQGKVSYHITRYLPNMLLNCLLFCLGSVARLDRALVPGVSCADRLTQYHEPVRLWDRLQVF